MESIDLEALLNQPEPVGSPPDPKDLLARIEAIEARQRANRHHDPGCPWLVREMAQANTDAYINPVECDCWLVHTA